MPSRTPVVAGRPFSQGTVLDADSAVQVLSQAYRDAEALLRAELERVVNIVAVDPGSTARYRRDQVRGLLVRVARLRAELDGRAVVFAEESLARIYVDGMRRADRLARATAGAGGQPSFTLLHREAVEMLAVDTFDDLTAANRFMETQAKRVLREAAKAQTTLGAITGSSVDRDARALVRRLTDRGVTSFVDAAGKNWRLSRYAEMVIRTKSAHAYNTGTVLRVEETGTTALEIVDGERSQHEECLAFNRKTCSPAWALANPIQHPNCVRGFNPLPLHDGGVDLGGDLGTARAAVQREARRRRDAGELPSDLVIQPPED